MPFFLKIFFSVWFRPSLFQISLEVPIKDLFYIYSRVFLQFASPSPRPWIYVLPSSLPLLDVCLLPITLFRLSCTFFHSFLPLTMLLWFICFRFSFHSGIDQQRHLGTTKSAPSLQFDTDHTSQTGLIVPLTQLPQNTVEKQSGTTSQWVVGNMAARKITLCSPGFQPSSRHFRSGSAFIMLLGYTGCISVKRYKAIKNCSRYYLPSVGMEKHWPHLYLADPLRLWGASQSPPTQPGTSCSHFADKQHRPELPLQSMIIACRKASHSVFLL